MRDVKGVEVTNHTVSFYRQILTMRDVKYGQYQLAINELKGQILTMRDVKCKRKV